MIDPFSTTGLSEAPHMRLPLSFGYLLFDNHLISFGKGGWESRLKTSAGDLDGNYFLSISQGK